MDRSVCRLVVALTKPIWVPEGALMSKATYEDVHGAAKFAERTESNAFYVFYVPKRWRLCVQVQEESSPVCFSLWSR